ncbi:DoxX family protein [Rugamonas sp. CCM 8940]|uniref:DoxX family protein n=1 Tax=Rugamonas sp. CCM 8940 TaxID=2765359 RepID=UPI0018F56362|nr:DoxX family protein [Rugamonas sp. CCM 8940]MBJ7311241.1 DoxX family protein [Rugamonas sp. CCM 8940]
MTPSSTATASGGRLRALAAAPAARWFCLLLLCSAYLQGGINKLTDFAGAVGEMQHFGLTPAAPLALAVIVGELGASALILSGFYRWLGACGLALFTVMATLLANRFWEMSGMERFMAANSFFEHLGLAGAFLLVAWHDLQAPAPAARR